MERELEYLAERWRTRRGRSSAILGGAKVSDKIEVIDHLLTKVDVLVLGGGMANTFLLAQGKAVGNSLAEPRPRGRAAGSWPRPQPTASG